MIKKVVVIDWDNTLCPTTYLKANNLLDLGPEDINPQTTTQLLAIEENALGVIRNAVVSSEVFILTNASLGWVLCTCQTYFSRLFRCLKGNQISIVSAREQFEEAYPEDHTVWKIMAVAQLVSKFNKKLKSFQLLGIGDQVNDIEAVKKISEENKVCISKTVKFCEAPSLETLHTELSWLHENIVTILNTTNSVNYRYTEKNIFEVIGNN